MTPERKKELADRLEEGVRDIQKAIEEEYDWEWLYEIVVVLREVP